MGPGDLKQTICSLVPKDSNILVGFENSDDASVYKLTDDIAIVQTLDFITPVVDDPYIYGKIAAANSLSDVFAMGGEVKTALNIVGFDRKNNDKNALKEILKGGNEKILECGGLLMGGHTIEAPEMFYGLSVTGVVHPNKIYKNNTAKIGHVLVLTKPLGIGILTTAIKRDLINESTKKEAIKVMESLNYLPSKVLRQYDVSSCTDVTGFGLLGHALEATNELTSFAIHCGEVPIIQDAQDFAEQDVVPGGTKRNMKYMEDKTTIMCDTSKCYQLYCDAQTSGGLLIAMDANDAKEYIKQIEVLTHGYAKIIGEVIPRGATPIIIY
ncbi:selenophosphate synthetase [Halarcobacter ebronensis]|uniref:Selenide, water dikinase SelD n=2 Tax=Halarcobacter ebronensis TaxID=1462615 RepID=A0A4Q1AP60_9BACT|nr:selenophosphate synthetase [Halarcobacter ebronensis]RXK04538.1 selenide, water dikinase SelD [Halarcobacter ebronensis]